MIIDYLHHSCESISNCTAKVVLLPIGSLEFHGKYLPPSIDTLIVDRLTRKYLEEGIDKNIIDSKEKCVILLPPIYYGYSPEWYNYECTVSLDRELFQWFIIHVYLSVARMDGFRGLIIVNGHGGNTSLLEAIARDITYNYGGKIAIIDIWKIAGKLGLKYCHACPFEVKLAEALGINVIEEGTSAKASLKLVDIDGIYFYGREGALGYDGLLPEIKVFIKEFYSLLDKILDIFLSS